MAVSLELFDTPAPRLNSFVAQCQPNIKEWKEDVVKAVRSVEKFLKEQHFQGDHGLDQKVLKVIQVLKETGPLHFPARAGQNPTHGSMSLRMLGTSCLIIPSLCY